MAPAGVSAVLDTPRSYDVSIGSGLAAAGTAINVGDWLAYSGSALFPTNAGHTAYWKASGQGIALEGNPTYDSWGRVVTATAIRFLRMGVVRVSGNASGNVALGIGVYPDATGSGVNSVTGLSGKGATWQSGVKTDIQGVGSAGSAAGGSGVAFLIGVQQMGAALSGTGQWDILLMPPSPDYY